MNTSTVVAFLTKEQKEELNNYAMPLLKTQLEFKFDPLYWKAKKEWIKETTNGEEVKQTFLHILVSFIWPETRSAEQISTLNKFIEVFFNVDDLEGKEKTSERLDDMVKVINGEKLPKEKNENLIVDVLNEVSSHYKPEQIDRLKLSMSNSVMGLKDENKKFNTLKEYIDTNRCVTIGVQPIIDLIPYSIGVDVTKYLSDPRMIELEKLLKMHAILINDYYSYKKEIAKQDDQIKCNMFLALYKTFGDCNWTYRTLYLYVEYLEKNILENKRYLLNVAEYDKNDDLRRYINGLEYVCSGFQKFLLIFPRYNQFNKISIDTALNHDFIDLKNEIKKLSFN